MFFFCYDIINRTCIEYGFICSLVIRENTQIYQGLSPYTSYSILLSENQVQIMLQVYYLIGCDTTGCDATSGMFSERQMDGRMYG